MVCIQHQDEGRMPVGAALYSHAVLCWWGNYPGVCCGFKAKPWPSVSSFHTSSATLIVCLGDLFSNVLVLIQQRRFARGGGGGEPQLLIIVNIGSINLLTNVHKGNTNSILRIDLSHDKGNKNLL